MTIQYNGKNVNFIDQRDGTYYINMVDGIEMVMEWPSVDRDSAIYIADRIGAWPFRQDGVFKVYDYASSQCAASRFFFGAN